MLYQISSGQGPAECEIAVDKFYKSLVDEFKFIDMVCRRKNIRTKHSESIIIDSEIDLSPLEGTIQWICKSPVRPHHLRKNWFINFSSIPYTEIDIDSVDQKDLRFESFRSSGHGGQNVNKTDSGVRITHIPSGLVVTSTKERSQYLNKRDAIQKLYTILEERNKITRARDKKEAWKKHNKLIRGNPVRVYVGEKFERRI